MGEGATTGRRGGSDAQLAPVGALRARPTGRCPRRQRRPGRGCAHRPSRRPARGRVDRRPGDRVIPRRADRVRSLGRPAVGRDRGHPARPRRAAAGRVVLVPAPPLPPRRHRRRRPGRAGARTSGPRARGDGRRGRTGVPRHARPHREAERGDTDRPPAGPDAGRARDGRGRGRTPRWRQRSRVVAGGTRAMGEPAQPVSRGMVRLARRGGVPRHRRPGRRGALRSGPRSRPLRAGCPAAARRDRVAGPARPASTSSPRRRPPAHRIPSG